VDADGIDPYRSALDELLEGHSHRGSVSVLQHAQRSRLATVNPRDDDHGLVQMDVLMDVLMDDP
jgi:hypothetical protein